jgi:hypothetical protein
MGLGVWRGEGWVEDNNWKAGAAATGDDGRQTVDQTAGQTLNAEAESVFSAVQDVGSGRQPQVPKHQRQVSDPAEVETGPHQISVRLRSLVGQPP